MDKKEEDMYNPIQRFFKKKGYIAYGEVQQLDVVCINEKDTEDLIVIEMKKNLTMKLLSQGVLGKKITEKVYIAYYKPNKFTLKKRREALRICKGLGLGVIVVKNNRVEILLEPKKINGVNIKKRKKILNEIKGIKVNINIGGCRGRKINTAFREKNIFIGCCLEKIGEGKGIELIKRFGTPKESTSIMYRNIYGWYDNVDRGIYTLNKKGIEELRNEEFKEVYNFYKGKVEKYDVHNSN